VEADEGEAGTPVNAENSEQFGFVATPRGTLVSLLGKGPLPAEGRGKNW